MDSIDARSFVEARVAGAIVYIFVAIRSGVAEVAGAFETSGREADALAVSPADVGSDVLRRGVGRDVNAAAVHNLTKRMCTFVLPCLAFFAIKFFWAVAEVTLPGEETRCTIFAWITTTVICIHLTISSVKATGTLAFVGVVQFDA